MQTPPLHRLGRGDAASTGADCDDAAPEGVTVWECNAIVAEAAAWFRQLLRDMRIHDPPDQERHDKAYAALNHAIDRGETLYDWVTGQFAPMPPLQAYMMARIAQKFKELRLLMLGVLGEQPIDDLYRVLALGWWLLREQRLAERDVEIGAPCVRAAV